MNAQTTTTTPSFSPLYQQIKTLLVQRLQALEWKPSEAIPSEMDLAKQLKVSQGTVRKAIEELVADKMLIRRQGKGTFVATHAEQRVQTRFLRLVPDTAESDEESDTYDKSGNLILVKRTITVCTRLKASDKAVSDVAGLLRLKGSDAVLHIQRILAYKKDSAKDFKDLHTPTILEDIWLPAALFKGLTLEKLSDSNAPLYAMFESEFGVHMTRATEKIRAVNPNTQEAKLLGVTRGTPLLQVERLSYTYNDTPLEVRRGLYRTDSRHYRNELV